MATNGPTPAAAEMTLVEAMMQPGFYPHRPQAVEVRQTHLSYAFLAGDYVFKVKKPVRFDFVDCSSLSLRYQLCCAELRLNRRLAPEVYLGVVPIIRDHGRLMLGAAAAGFDPNAAEYAVKMRRLPEDRMLDRMVRSGAAGLALMGELARKLAAFHRAASSAAGWRYGSATAVRRTLLGNLEECRRFVGDTLEDRQFDAIGRFFDTFIAAHSRFLNDRVRHGRIRDGHGDLRCEHVFAANGLQIIDCLEFSEALRYADVASDLAFLAMDLDSLGAWRLADELVRAYADSSGDEQMSMLVNFYLCHRACVRGKVNSLKSRATEVSPPERESARERARARFSQAFAYALRGRPALVVVCGLSGTGKTTLARELQCRLGFETLDSDRVRKRLAGVAESFDGSATYAAGIYTPAFDRLTYDALLAEARAHLHDGRGVIVEATFRRPDDRRAALACANDAAVPVLFVECRTAHAEILRRLRERSVNQRGPSDATGEVYLRQRAEFVPLDEIPARRHLVADTTAGVAAEPPRIEAALRELF